MFYFYMVHSSRISA